MQKLISEWVAARTIAGGIAGLSFSGAPFTYAAAGAIAVDSQTPFDENSLCRIYSMTKSITGVAVMKLIERGDLQLDQPVVDVIPEWRVSRVAVDPKKGLESKSVTGVMRIRHLLTHTSGLDDWAPSAGSGPLPSAYRERGITPGNRGTRVNRPGYGPQARDLAQMVERVAELPLAFEPGTAYLYSSIGYAALGLAIERISGKSLDVFFRERIFEPLKMTSTGFMVQRTQTARLTTNYDVTPSGLTPTDAAESSAWLEQPTLLDGAGGVISTARDFARFTTMLINDGSLEDTQVLRPETVRLARSNLLPAGITRSVTQPQTPISLTGGYGAGMHVALTEQGKRFRAAGSVSHAGSGGTLWIADPRRRATLVFMAQRMLFVGRAQSDLIAAIEADLA